jgi:hypothetical protein
VTPVVADGGIVQQYGKITLSPSNAQIGDKVYYQGLLNSLGDPCHSTPAYATPPATFTQVDGFVYLDFCTWSIEPSSRCQDFQPASDDCGTTTCP